MKESSQKKVEQRRPSLVKHYGYKDSGFVFYFVQCHDRDTLKDYALRHPGNERFFENGNLPFGLSYCSKLDVLGGVLPEAKGTELWVGYMLVAQTDKKYPLSPRDVRRHWHHEIGHMASFFASEYCRTQPYDGALCGEAGAYCTEYLEECLGDFMEELETPPMSGMPLLFPWTRLGQLLAEEEEGSSK